MNLIDTLNLQLAREYGAWLSYVTAAAWASGPHGESARELFEEHAEEEAKHAKALALHIVGLGGIPTVSVCDIAPPQSLPELLAANLQLEQEAVEAYTALLKHPEITDRTRVLIEDILLDESEHVDELLRLTTPASEWTNQSETNEVGTQIENMQNLLDLIYKAKQVIGDPDGLCTQLASKIQAASDHPLNKVLKRPSRIYSIIKRLGKSNAALRELMKKYSGSDIPELIAIVDQISELVEDENFSGRWKKSEVRPIVRRGLEDWLIAELAMYDGTRSEIKDIARTLTDDLMSEFRL